MSPPRITPLADAEMSEAERTALEPFARADGGGAHNVFRTMGRHPDALRRWTPFIRHVLAKSSLTRRETELLILRVAALRGSDYAWTQHVRIGRAAGLSDRQILGVREGPGAAVWTVAEADLLSAADDLVRDARISDDVWDRLATRYSQVQLIDLILTVGQYNMATMVLKTCGVEIDDDFASDPPLREG